MTAIATIFTILCGVLLIAVLTPLAQFLTIGMLNADMETASPSGWCVGLLVSVMLVVGAVRALSRSRRIPRGHFVLLYAMLTIAVPMMNLGMARPVLLSLRAVQHHFVTLAQNTYRTAYEAQSPSWFPVVPTTEGLAWNKAERLLVLLRDPRVTADRERARRELILQIHAARQTPSAASPEAAAQAAARIARLGPDDAQAVAAAIQGDELLQPAAAALGITEPLARRLSDTAAASLAAATRLASSLAAVDEHEAYYVPAVAAELDRGARLRLDQDRRRLDDDGRAALQSRTEALAAVFDQARADVTALGRDDWSRVRSVRAAARRAALDAMSDRQRTVERASFVYRSTTSERAAIPAQNGQAGTPNQYLVGFHKGLESRVPSKWDEISAGATSVPWSIWLPPLVRWTALVVCLFVFLMCLAEWLRRKWVERENLAFPLVEIVDNLIRHGDALEQADDVRVPPARRWPFSSVFLAGAALGALVIAVEAMGHYRITRDVHLMAMDVSKQVFTAGPLKEMDRVIFVLSPIVVGILFLVSLEISFSIWATFLIYSFIFFFGRQIAGDVKDSLFTGWAGGRFYPFPMEQLLGASVCFAAILLAKAWRARGGSAEGPGAAYIPPRLNVIGLAVAPLAALALVWNLGVTNVLFVLLVALLLLALTIAAARARAEAGLHTQHVTYEFTKLPMAFGLTGWTGSKVFALFVSLTCLPVTLLFRTLPQQLENIELARRNGVSYRSLAAATLVAFLTAVPIGLISLLVLCYMRGATVFNSAQTPGCESIMSYPLWVSHFLGERGLDQMRQPHTIRVWYTVAGFAAFGVLSLLRSRFMRFPIHPLGYLLVLLSVYYEWVSPYYKGSESLSARDASWIWGSAFVAWLVKKHVIKYGGMNTYKKAKPLFIGMVAGALVCLFVVNVTDLAASVRAERPGVTPGEFLKKFMEVPPYNPRVY